MSLIENYCGMRWKSRAECSKPIPHTSIAFLWSALLFLTYIAAASYKSDGERTNNEGVDSFVGEFVGDGITLRFDFGGYSNPLKEETKPAYVVVHKSIGGFRAKVVSPRTPGHGITGVYFRDVGHATALCLWGKDLTSTQQELALKILETIRFGGPPPRYVLPPPPAKNVP
jgi:hypothetical protein